MGLGRSLNTNFAQKSHNQRSKKTHFKYSKMSILVEIPHIKKNKAINYALHSNLVKRLRVVCRDQTGCGSWRIKYRESFRNQSRQTSLCRLPQSHSEPAPNMPPITCLERRK